VVGRRRYANLARSLDMPYSLGNIVFGKQVTHEAHHGALRQSPKERRSQKQQMVRGNLLILNEPKGVLEVRIVRWG